jgi:hypothetical protein
VGRRPAKGPIRATSAATAPERFQQTARCAILFCGCSSREDGTATGLREKVFRRERRVYWRSDLNRQQFTHLIEAQQVALSKMPVPLAIS